MQIALVRVSTKTRAQFSSLQILQLQFDIEWNRGLVLLWSLLVKDILVFLQLWEGSPVRLSITLEKELVAVCRDGLNVTLLVQEERLCWSLSSKLSLFSACHVFGLRKKYVKNTPQIYMAKYWWSSSLDKRSLHGFPGRRLHPPKSMVEWDFETWNYSI